MNKHAYLIMAHNEFHMLKKLISELDDDRNDIFLHIDKKALFIDEKEVKSWAKKSNVILIPRRNIYWGDMSIVNCEIELLKAATKGRYAYYHLLSGVCFPLKSIDEIHNFFERENSEFIGYHRDGEYDDHFLYKVKYYFPFMKIAGKGPYEGPGKKMTLIRQIAGFQQRLVDYQEKHGIDRTKKYVFNNIYKGDQWFSITHDLAKYILSKKSLIRKYYSMTNCPDEFFVANLAMNSAFADRVKNDSLREIDWKKGSPYEYTTDDLDFLKDSDCLFARKFSFNRSPELIFALTDHIHHFDKLKHDPLISVIVPCYNVEKYLAECVDSLVAQSYQNLEILLIDDGSTDATGKIAKDYADKYDNVSYHFRENGGLSAARNTGIEVSKGEYIAFVDSDDYVDIDFIEKLYAALSDKNADMAVCGLQKEEMSRDTLCFDKDLILSSHAAMRFLGDIYCKESTLLVVAWNKLYKKSLFENTGFPEGKLHEDEFTCHRIISQCEQIATISDCLYHYRIREGSITSDGRSQDIRHRDYIDALIDRLKSSRNMYFGDLYIFMLYTCFEGVKQVMYVFSDESIKKYKIYSYLRKKMLPVYFGNFKYMDSHLKRYGLKFFLFPNKCRNAEIIHRDGSLKRENRY